MLFTCLTIFISFIIILVLSKFHLTCMGSPKVKNCDQRRKSTAQGRKPRAAFSSLRLNSLFFSLWLIGLSLLTPLCLALNRLTCLLQTIRKKSSQQLTYLIPDIKVCIKEQIRLILTKLTKSECLQR